VDFWSHRRWGPRVPITVVKEAHSTQTAVASRTLFSLGWCVPTPQALLCSIYCDPDLTTATTPLTVAVGQQPAIRVASTAGGRGFQPCQPGSLTVWSELENEPYRYDPKLSFGFPNGGCIMVDEKCGNGGGVVRHYLDNYGFPLPRIDQPDSPPLHTEPSCDPDESVIGGLVCAQRHVDTRNIRPTVRSCGGANGEAEACDGGVGTMGAGGADGGGARVRS
jgi:hypothetical protein